MPSEAPSNPDVKIGGPIILRSDFGITMNISNVAIGGRSKAVIGIGDVDINKFFK